MCNYKEHRKVTMGKSRKGYIQGSKLHKSCSPLKQTQVLSEVKDYSNILFDPKKQATKTIVKKVTGVRGMGFLGGIAAIKTIGKIKDKMAEDDFVPEWKRTSTSYREHTDIDMGSEKIKKIINPKGH